MCSPAETQAPVSGVGVWAQGGAGAAVPTAGCPSASWLPWPCPADGPHRGGEAANAEAGRTPAVTQAKGKRNLELGEDVEQSPEALSVKNTRLIIES